MENWYETKPCDDWDDFLRKVRALPSSVFYRGQSYDTQSLKSSFDRAIEASQPLVRDRWQYEAAIIREFTRRAHHYVVDTLPKDDLLEWLSLMRHYGAPTRLVDFTYSYYIAAYFAFSDLGCNPRAVWAIYQDWLNHESERHYREVLDSSSLVIDLNRPQDFRKCFFDPARKPGSSRSFVAAVNAERMNTRLTIQQGLFLCPGDIERPFENNLSSMVSRESSQKAIVKFVIPHSARNRALTELKYMNISRASLFPDLGGLAMSLNDRFELLFKDYNISEQTLQIFVACKK
jgi:hypothetical protein